MSSVFKSQPNFDLHFSRSQYHADSAVTKRMAGPKVSKPSPGLKVIQNLVLNSTENGIYPVHKCKNVGILTLYIKSESFFTYTRKKHLQSS